MNLMEVRGLRKYFQMSSGFLSKPHQVRAVDGVDFTIEQNKVFSIVGESGSGKSTVARLLLRLIEPQEGDVLFKGTNVLGLKGEALKAYRRSVQIIFQDPFASLNPRMKIFNALCEPLKIHKTVPKSQFRQRVSEMLQRVGLTEDVMSRYPHEFSGGQRQRICIARALMLGPELVVADEPLSSLDVSIQAQILNLLIRIKGEIGLSFLFISHDLNVVQYFSDSIAVMYLGKIVESGQTEQLFENPLHPYTQMLIESVPKITGVSHHSHDTAADTPSPIEIPPGCPFHPRCAKRLAACSSSVPELIERNGRVVACHLY
ncbi:MAG: ATP-binding cassette domain-containing protein [Candidatus Magnetominusculus sp. LBB02]|nr:ATP-binding cassette domain-containing protein [Candidatus Magnetominusculus sp. LBB02]